MRFDPISLQLFVECVECGSISAAAERMHMVTSAASKRITDLEYSLKVSLLRRNNRGVQTTAAGDALYVLAKNALRRFNDILSQMEDFSTGVRETIKIYGSITAISQYLPQDLSGFISAHPSILLDFEERPFAGIIKSIVEGAADLGVSLYSEVSSEIAVHPYRTYRLVVLAPADHPVAQLPEIGFADTLDYPHVGLEAYSGANVLLSRKAEELGQTVNYRMRVKSYDAMAMLIEAGAGLGIAPEGIARLCSHNVRIKQILLKDAWGVRQLALYSRPYASLSKGLQALINHLKGVDLQP